MPRYELIEGTSNKFWDITHDGVTVTVRWGKVGTAGQSNTKTFASAAEAKKEHDKLVGEKTRKGYLLADAPGAPGVAATEVAAHAGTAFKLADVDRLDGAPGDSATKFMGQRIADYDPEEGLKEPARRACRLRQDESVDDFLATFAQLVADPSAGKLKALVISGWSTDAAGGSADDDYVRQLRKAIVGAAGKLTGLAALFINDTFGDEYEVSWQYFTDLSPILDAYPGLEHLRVRGDATGKKMGTLKSASLRSLQLEGLSLNRKLVQQVARAELPALEYLELWLGPEEYAGKKSMADLAPILSGELFPKLRYLGLRDSDVADEVAKAVAKAPILGQLETLDLSLGTIGDAGVEALLASPALAKLQTLDIRRHYVSKAVLKQLKALPIKVLESRSEQDVDEDEPERRYVTVAE